MNVDVQIYTEFKHDFGLPQYETAGAAGMDVRANAEITVRPGETKLIPTGIFVAIPDGYEIQVRPRSGLSLKTKLRVANSPGTVDCIPEYEEILTEVGFKPLSWLKDNMNTKIYSYNIDANTKELDTVKDIWCVGEKELLEIEFDDGTKTLCTRTQLVLTEELGWVKAEELSINVTVK